MQSIYILSTSSKVSHKGLVLQICLKCSFVFEPLSNSCGMHCFSHELMQKFDSDAAPDSELNNPPPANTTICLEDEPPATFLNIELYRPNSDDPLCFPSDMEDRLEALAVTNNYEVKEVSR